MKDRTKGCRAEIRDPLFKNLSRLSKRFSSSVFWVLTAAMFYALPLQAQSGENFFTVTPCRAVDTRDPNGPWGGPALIAGASRTFQLANRCGITATTRTVAVNITITEGTAPGHLTLYPPDAALPATSNINYRAGQTRANNAILRLGSTGDVAVFCGQGSGTVHFILDVVGYFGAPLGPPITARFLEQATWGPTDDLIRRVETIGFRAFLDGQFAAPMSSYPTLPLRPGNQDVLCGPPGSPDRTQCIRDNYTIYPLQLRFFENALYGEDQLRQRVAFALHQMFVVSQRDIQQPSHMAPYLQILDQNAFGNFRQILYEMTLHPTMGQYLDMVRSTRTNPNENYAREILQLFSIGTDLLNLDGTPQRDAQGEPLPSYDQAIVDGFTKVFTGWTFAAQPQPGVVNYIDPMVLVANRHEQGTKQLLNGVVLPACATPPANCTAAAAEANLNAGLDNIFNHPNTGPFVSMHLIRQLVTSNPSPAYVRRVATVFNNNGQGTRGDLKAVVEAILLDPEARNDAPPADYGHLKEPALYITNLLRAFNALSADGSASSDGYLGPQTVALDQDIFRAPTVFNYYPNDFVAPGTTLLGPEFGILSASTTLRRANFVNTMLQDMNVNRTNPRLTVVAVGGNSPAGTSIDLSPLLPLASDPAQLVGELNRLLTHGSMSTAMRDSIIQAVGAVSSSNPLLRARQAVYLVATSSQYQVQR